MERGLNSTYKLYFPKKSHYIYINVFNVDNYQTISPENSSVLTDRCHLGQGSK